MAGRGLARDGPQDRGEVAGVDHEISAHFDGGQATGRDEGADRADREAPVGPDRDVERYECGLFIVGECLAHTTHPTHLAHPCQLPHPQHLALRRLSWVNSDPDEPVMGQFRPSRRGGAPRGDA